MDKKSKVNSGLNDLNFNFQKQRNAFSESEKRHIIQDFLNSNCTKREVWEKYTGEVAEHGKILSWMRQFGYIDSNTSTRPKFTINNIVKMDKNKPPNASTHEDFEILQLKKRIAALEMQLKESEMKAIAFSTMVDIAERELNIPIRKKFNTKPSKK